MRAVLYIALVSATVIAFGNDCSVSGQTPKDKSKDTPKEAPKNTPKVSAAEFTRTRLLKTKVTGSFQDVRIGDILKEFADQVDTKGDQPVFWAYGTGFPFSQKVSFNCND